MAYYDALIAIWPTLIGKTTDEKLSQLNDTVVSGSVPTDYALSAVQIYNCLDRDEFIALTPANQQLIRDILLLGNSIPVGAGTMAKSIIQFVFVSNSKTRGNFNGLAKASKSSWWEANGYKAPTNINDLKEAGLI